MALETLKDKTEIGGFPVAHCEKKKWTGQDKDSPAFIQVNHDSNEITFKIQNGPIKESGVNGCQVDTIMETARDIIEGLNAEFPCMENGNVINHLNDAIFWLNERTKNRQARNVEGTSQE